MGAPHVKPRLIGIDVGLIPPAMPITLRPVVLSDIEPMYQLDLLCFDAPFRFDRRTMRRLATEPHAIALLAEQDSALAGFVILNITRRARVSSGYLSTLDVHPAHRRNGLAQQLMEAAESSATLADITYLRLHVSAENEPAIRFYEKIGYKRMALVNNFYAEGLHAWHYVKNLIPYKL